MKDQPCQDHQPLFLSIIDSAGSKKHERAKAVCATCPEATKAECLSLGWYDGRALEGIYGGLTHRERLAMSPPS